MLQAHGSVPFDPYHALQLAISAPRDLIAEAYWLLTARARTAGGDATRDLRDAHAFLMDSAARAAYDAAHRRTATALDYYALLGIDADADSEIVALAYGIALRTAPPYQQDAIGVAHATLANPYRRALYDASLGHSMMSSAPAQASIAPRPPRIQIVAGEAPPALAARERSAVVPEQLRLALDPPLVAPASPRRHRRSLPAHKLASPVELRPHVAPVLPSPHSMGELVAELRFVDGPLVGASVLLRDGALTMGGATADLPLAGVAAAALRVWRLDDRYLLRRLGEVAVTLDGVAMALPSASLEAGSVIEIGAHRVVFAFRRSPQAMLPSMQTADDRVAR